MIANQELQRWLKTIDENEDIWVDPEALMLSSSCGAFYVIAGNPDFVNDLHRYKDGPKKSTNSENK